MRAVGIEKAGGPEVLGVVEVPVPRPGGGEVLIAVEAAGVNRPDVFQRQGLYPPPPGASEIPGLEVAGTVVAVGEGWRLEIAYRTVYRVNRCDMWIAGSRQIPTRSQQVQFDGWPA